MNTQGYIIIRQPILRSITEKEVQEVVLKNHPSDAISLFKQVEFPSIHKKIIPHQEIKNIQWQVEARNHQQIYQQQLKPLIEKYPDYKLVYFGAAPVALATYLGSLLGTWHKVIVFLLNHKGDKEWYQKDPSGTIEEEWPDFSIASKGVPQEENNSTEDIAITVATSYPIDSTSLKNAISGNVAKLISLQTASLELDLPAVDIVNKMSDHFRVVMNQVAKNLNQAETIHLATSIPCGLAFLLGTSISANVHPTIQLYQYDTNEVIPYIPVLKIGQPLQEILILEEEQQQLILQEKEAFEKQEWGRLQNWIQQLQEEREDKKSWLKTWPKGVKKASSHFEFYFWEDLPAVYRTPLLESNFSTQPLEEDLAFEEKEALWKVGDVLWFNIKKAVQEEPSKLQRAIRLLLFHEGMHYWKHNLKGPTSKGIGRFPKILERADYQSDVWAMWQEYFYTSTNHHQAIDKDHPSKFFVELIEIALSTMWAFDAVEGELVEMQIRRVNRYLIWYWQQLRLEDKQCKTLEEVAAVLAEMPVLEIKGLITKVEGERIFYVLDRLAPVTTSNNLELGIWWNNSIVRKSSIDAYSIPNLIEAFREGSSQDILQFLRAVYGTLSR